MEHALRSNLAGLAGAVASVLLVLAGLLWLADAQPFEALAAFADSSLGGRRFAYLMSTVSRTALIGGMALSVLICFRAGLFNIGGEGQLVLGGLAAALAGLHLAEWGIAGIALSMLAGMAAGAAWAMLAGSMQLWLGVPVLVGSLLLNYPARFIASYFVSHPLRDVASGMSQTHLLSRDLWLPFFPGTRLDIGILFILAVYALVLLYSHRTVQGYYARMNGLSQDFAEASGLPTRRIALQTLGLAGAIAGLVGALVVLGIQHRFTDGMLVQPLYAWTGVIAALLANLSPWAILPAGFFFAALHSGAAGMERTADVPKEIAIVVQGAIILFVAAGHRHLGGSSSPDEGES